MEVSPETAEKGMLGKQHEFSVVSVILQTVEIFIKLFIS